MKNISVIVFMILIIQLKSYAQKADFEGKIEFDTHIKANKPQVKTAIYKEAYGTAFTALIKDGYYKQLYKGASSIEWVIYHPKTNRYYFKKPSVDTLFYIDCSKESQPIEVKRTPGKEVILGYKCRSLKIRSATLKSTVFYAPELPVNPEYFSQFKLHANDKVIKLSRSAYLKWVTEYEFVTITLLATKVQRTKLNYAVFSLPKLPLKQVRQ
ncbi:MAG: hypothetical protein ABIN95_04585 [Mucilaginibacter sp.]